MSKPPLYPHTTVRVGYRIQPMGESVAWEILNFEYEELGNEHTREDVANFLKISPRLSWSKVLSEFRKRYGDIVGEWVSDRLKDAIYYYSHVGEEEPIYRVEYDSGQTVINLGEEGRFVLNPRNATFRGNTPKEHATAFR